ncbi:MAG: hypothetical protein ABI867_23355 [Kofleriaceae bacterium]
MRCLVLLVLLSAACERAGETPSPPTPTPAPIPVPMLDAGTVDTRTACDVIAVKLEVDGIWVGAPPNIRCYGPKQQGVYPFAWLDDQLHMFKDAIDRDCTPSFQVAADSSTPYQEMVHVMDLAIRRGFLDIGFADSAGLEVKFDRVDLVTAKTCSAPTRVSPGPRPRTVHLPPDKHALKAAPVIAVSKTAIFLDGTQIVDLATLPSDYGIPTLTKALGTPKGSTMVILQADASTSAILINRIVTACKAAGFDDLLFATSSKKP